MAEGAATRKELIISLGGSPEPVVKAITIHRPEVVCFFASQQSVGQVGSVLDRAGATDQLWRPTAQYTVLTDDSQDLIHCYEKAPQCAAWIEEQGIPPEDVVVDYTGGTKAMTAALALATIGKGYRRLQEESKQFNVVCRGMVEDLVANADRRATEGKYDDAVARLYRATEMVAQVRFRAKPLEC